MMTSLAAAFVTRLLPMAADAFIQCRVTPEIKALVRTLAQRDRNRSVRLGRTLRLFGGKLVCGRSGWHMRSARVRSRCAFALSDLALDGHPKQYRRCHISDIPQWTIRRSDQRADLFRNGTTGFRRSHDYVGSDDGSVSASEFDGRALPHVESRNLCGRHSHAQSRRNL